MMNIATWIFKDRAKAARDEKTLAFITETAARDPQYIETWYRAFAIARRARLTAHELASAFSEASRKITSRG